MVQERTEKPEESTAAPPPTDMSWKNMTIQWGTRAPVHPQGGLTIGALNVGAYGEIPDYWEDRSRMPRGAFTPPGARGAPIGGYYLRHKSDLWADNAPELYEEAISRRGELAHIPLLQKPFEPGQLLTAVRAVLDEESTGAPPPR